MDRREAVRNVAFLMGGALSATTLGVFLDSCSSPSANKGSNLFSPEQDQIITEVADIIIPNTKTPGAKAAGVGPFISMMIKECYPEDAQKAFVKGLEDLEDRSKKDFGKSFLQITVKEREELLGKLRTETIAAQKVENDKKNKDKEKNAKPLEKPLAAQLRSNPTPYFFAIARDLTILGYFTSEIGATKALEYVQIPGRYDGCVDLKPGQRAYS